MTKPSATIDWNRSDFEIELDCTCGQWSANSGYPRMQPTIQCPHCQRIFHTDSIVELLPDGTDPWRHPSPPGPSNCFQWKNVDAHLTCQCQCGTQFEATGDFLYHVTCPSCKTKYTCATRLTFSEIQASEAPGEIHRLVDDFPN